MKTYIVTGGAGFIGSRLAKRLVDAGNRVHILDDLSTGFERNVPPGAVFYKVDVSRMDELRGLALPGKIDVMYHFAAQSSGEASFDDPFRDMEVNYGATYNTLKLAEEKGCRRYIYASSMSVYGETDKNEYQLSEDYRCRPISYYGCNKLASERLVMMFGKRTGVIPTVFRLFSVYGPGQNMLNMKQGIVSIYFSYLLKGKPVHVKGSLERFRDLVYVEDAIDAFVKSENNERTHNEIFNLGTGMKTTVEDMLKIILESYGGKDFKKWVCVEGNTQGDITGCVANTAKLTDCLGWKPKYNLREGISKMKAWLDETNEDRAKKNMEEL